MKVAFITNIPAPYREKVHENVANKLGVESYHVFYCNKTEQNRTWEFKYGKYSKTFLKSRSINHGGKTVYYNADIWKQLNDFNPEVVITVGFNPTMLIGFAWAKLNKKQHIPFSDAHLLSERHLSSIHKFIRSIIYKYSRGFIGASRQTAKLYNSYGVSEKSVFLSYLCADNSLFKESPLKEKTYDLLFVGRIDTGKLPFFFLEVAKRVKKNFYNLKVLIVGSGPLQADLIKEFKKNKISYHHAGFIQPNKISSYYKDAKILLFPTIRDAWGVVANEANAAGIPVITCENAGCANDLIINKKNGYVLPLDPEVWSEKINLLLNDKTLYQNFCKNALKYVEKYNFQNAANGIVDACNFVMKNNSYKK